MKLSDAVRYCDDFNDKIKSDLTKTEVQELLSTDLHRTIDELEQGGLKIDSTNIIVNVGKSLS